MTDSPRQLRVFLCYASPDKSVVRALSQRLSLEDWIDVWIDENKLLPGQDWRINILDAVETSDIVIICLSNNSVNKEGYVQKELRYAQEIALEKPEDSIFLIPLRLEECNVPRGLRFYQWVDYFGESKDSSYKALVASLKLRYEQKIKSEEAERLRRELQEREIAEKTAAEQAWLKAQEEERRRIARKKAELDAAEKVARDKAEKEVAEKTRLQAEEKERQRIAKEKADRERKNKEARLKIERETSEKAKRGGTSAEKVNQVKKDVKPEVSNSSSGNQVAYWIAGFALLVFGIFFLSSLTTPSSSPAAPPTNTRMIMNTATLTPTLKLTKTQTPINTITVTPIAPFTETSVENTTSSDNSQKLYFVTENGDLMELDVVSETLRSLVTISIYNSTSLFWLSESELVNFPYVYKLAVNNIENALEVIDVSSNQIKKISRSDYYYFVSSSDMSINNQIVINFSGDSRNGESSISIATIDSDGNLPEVPTVVDVDLSFGSPGCIRWSPNGKLTAANIWQGLSSSLGIFRIGPGERPLVIKTNVRSCPSWSPDGRYIAYGNSNPSHLEEYEEGVFYIDYLLGSVTKLTDTYGFNPAWSPDGKRIAFITESGISLIDVNTKEETQIYYGSVLTMLWGK